MKVFISWSGELSREIGLAFRNWLPDVLQFVQPYFTPTDIEKGQRWSTEIADQLESSKIGLFCLTADNLNAPWLIFEAGAISRSTATARVCTLLFGVETAQVTGPLVQFQATLFSKDEVLKFVTDINTNSPTPLPEPQLNRAFERLWPELELTITALLSRPTPALKPPHRSMSEMVEETLDVVRTLATRQGSENTELDQDAWNELYDFLALHVSESIRISQSVDQVAQLDQLKSLQKFTQKVLHLTTFSLNSKRTAAQLTRIMAVRKSLQKRITELESLLGDIPF